MDNMLGIDTVLLLALSLPWPLKYRIFPMEGTPYVLFGVYFVLLLAYIALDLGWLRMRTLQGKWRAKLAVLIAVIAIAAGGPLITAIVDRSRIAPVFGVHDIILQLEAAMRYLIDGINPYRATYFGTHMEAWHYAEFGKDAVNPALYHFIMPPWYVIFPFFFYPFVKIFGFFDGRLPLLFTFVGMLTLLAVWIKDYQKKILALIIVAFHPVMFDYLLEGRSDHFAFFWLLLALYLLHRKRFVLAAVVYALAMLSKQTIWLSFPFVILYVSKDVAKQSVTRIVLVISAFLGTVALVLGPFLVWDPSAYWESTVAFLQGSTPVSYPVAGYGLGMVLYQLGVIKDIHAYYPFVYWQAAVLLPTLWFLIRWFRAKRSAGRLLIAYSVFLFVFWYFSRYFHNSHLGYISLVLSVGYFLEES
jgi:uncharacterized membrane protein